ncbi:MAG: FAD-dependent oxidoreductase [Holophagaceae bacterium]
MAETVDILVVGGGIAGLATAMHLAREGGRGVLLLDREDHPGFHASGHNAAIARQLTGRAEHTALTVEGRQALADAGLLQPTGGLLLALDASALDPLEAEAESVGLPVERGEGSVLPGLKAAAHLRIPSDGVIDVHGMLGFCAREARAAGAVLRYGCGVEAVEATVEGFTVATGGGTVHAAVLVNAAGAWASALGRKAGGLDLDLKPLRRHLAWSEGPWPADAPWAWWVDRPFYLRPESGGLLMCPCDETEVAPPARGHQPDTDPAAMEQLAALVQELAPDLADHGIVRAWSGLRTFAPDRRFVIGWDPVNPRLFWVAGLGGHGMTSGLAVGRLAAALMELDALPRHPLSPARFG